MRITTSGSFKNFENFAKKTTSVNLNSILTKYGEMGVQALSRATPVETGETSKSWYFKITNDKGGSKIEWYNTKNAGATPLVILLHYGHATGTGGYVTGTDFINTTLAPIFEKMAKDLWREVTR